MHRIGRYARTVLTCVILAGIAGCAMPDRLRQIRLPTSRGVDVGTRYLAAENYPGAVECFVQAIEADGQDAMAHAWLGVTYARMGRFTDAKYELRIARDLGETSVTRIGAGEIFLKLGEPKKALTEFSQAGVRRPSAASYEGMARASARLDDPTQVLYAYEKAIALAGPEEQTRIRMAAADYCLARQDYANARQFLGQKVYLGAEYAPEKDGIRIVAVRPGWPADTSGLKTGDVLLKLGDRSLKGLSMKRFGDYLNGLKPGAALKADVVRGGQPLTLDLQTDFVAPPDPAGAATPAARPTTWAQPLKIPGVSNLFKVSETLYRSAQPDENAFAALAAAGIRTVVSLRSFHGEGDPVTAAGLGYQHLYVKSWGPESKEVVAFLETATDPAKVPVLVHCQHGADRTGVMVAFYRIAVQGWNKEDAIREMTEGGYGFHAIWQNLVQYVRDYDTDSLRAALRATQRTPAS